MSIFLSKRAKVVSDKPAYEKKEKSDSGGTIYRYSPKHIEKRWKEKKEKLKKLDKNIDKVRDQYEKDMSSDDLRTQAEACIVAIIDDTAMRVGNEDSVKESETYGATTLKVKHLTISGNKARFKFVGKDHVDQDVESKNPKVIKVLKELIKDKKDNDFIFEIDGKKIWDRAINRYLNKFNISAKDLRGFQANRIMKEQLKKKDWKDALEETAKIVGHEPNTLKNQYLDPELVYKHDKKAFLINTMDIIKTADIYSVEEKMIENPITESMIKRIYELEFKIHQLKTDKDYDKKHSIKNSIKKFENELDKLLDKALSAMEKVYAWWIKYHSDMHDECAILDKILWSHSYLGAKKIERLFYNYLNGIPTQLDADFEKAKTEVRREMWNKQPFSGIYFMYKKLQKGSNSLEDRLILFNNALRTVHQGGPMLNHFSEKTGVSAELLKKLTEDVLDENSEILKQTELNSQDLKLVRNIKNQLSISKKLMQINDNDILPGVKMNSLLYNAWKTLKPFLPPGTKLTSGFRTPEDQKRILINYWKKAGLSENHPDFGNYNKMSVILKQFGYIVGPPQTSSQFAHLHGNSFDLSGANLNEIAEAVRKVSKNPDLKIVFKEPLIETGNNAVHVSVANSEYNENNLKRSASFEIDERIVGLDDEMGDWFEKSPIFIFREEEPEYDLLGATEEETKKLIQEEPEKFFYRGLHKKYPNLEKSALENIIKINAKFFFIFKYNESDDDDILSLTDLAAEFLSQQDARAFFYYHLHHIYPELGRGSIIQLIDTNPDSFFDLGLDKDYPDYIESANAARNIKDPNKVELEQPEWIRNEPDSFGLRDKNASLQILTKKDLENIYKLEYQLSIAEKELYSEQITKALKEEFKSLLVFGIKELTKAFKSWIEAYERRWKEDAKELIKIYKELPSYADMPEELLRDILKDKHFTKQPYVNIKHMYERLLKEDFSDLRKASILFNNAIGTVHYTGTMIEHIPGFFESGIDKKLLDELSSKKYTPKWNKELRKLSKLNENSINDYIISKLKQIPGEKHWSDKIVVGKIETENESLFWSFMDNSDKIGEYSADAILSEQIEEFHQNKKIFRFSSLDPIEVVLELEKFIHETYLLKRLNKTAAEIDPSLSVGLEKPKERSAIEINPEKNINNVAKGVDFTTYPEINMAWRVLAPFLPTRSYLMSGYRDDYEQAKTIIEHWKDFIWENGKKAKGNGFFATNFSEKFGLNISKLAELYNKALAKKLNNSDLQILEKLRVFMTTYKASGKKNEPKQPLQIAAIGRSPHRSGLALDISGPRMNEILKAIKFVSDTFNFKLLSAPRMERSNNAVHIELGGINMPEEHEFLNALEKFYNNK